MIRRVKNLYHLFSALLAVLVFRFPASKITVIGVTGTDGKTTVAHLIYEILKEARKKVSLVSSVGAEVAGTKCDTGFHVTTPNPWLLQKIVRHILDRGGEYLVLEVTSHALDQHRVLGIPFKIGVLTNVTHEHFDYHKTYENYLAAKLKLFNKAKIAVVNSDDRSYQCIESLRQKGVLRKVISYGIRKKADFTPRSFSFTTSLPGEYNQYNCLAAIAAVKQLGIEDKIIHQVLAQFKGVIGRFEFIDTHRDFRVMVDFAHTPNGFKQVLKTIRPRVKGRLIHVFGCAGLRDYQKRPVMGQISAKYADVIILTEEDYRTEDINKIIGEIAEGCCKKIKNQKLEIFKIQDRQRAIEKAIRLARKGDLVLLTGKGHEKSLCRGKKEYPWSEHEAVKRVLETLN